VKNKNVYSCVECDCGLHEGDECCEFLIQDTCVRMCIKCAVREFLNDNKVTVPNRNTDYDHLRYAA